MTDEKKTIDAQNAGAALYRSGTLFVNQIIFIAEREADARAIEAAGGAAVALDGADAIHLINLLTEWNDDESMGQRGQGAAIICMNDTDTGRKRSGELLRSIHSIHTRCIERNLCGICNTVQDAAAADPARFAQEVQAAQAAAAATHMPDALDAFLEEIQTEEYKPYTTGITFLDELLSGGIINKTLTLLMAGPGTGKTTLAQQVAEAMATAGTPVVFLSLEMAAEQMLAKVISSRLAQKGAHTYDQNGNPADIDATKVLQGYTWTAHEKEVITAEIDAYRQGPFKNLKYIDPKKADASLAGIIDYLDKTGSAAKAAGTPAPVVILDYLHLISSKDLDTPELIKQAVKALKDYAVNYDTTVICIVAVNRESMKKGQLSINSARDSSSIEYMGDYIITLNYYDFDRKTKDPQDDGDLAELQKERYRRMILRLPKSRFGQPGRHVKVYYNAAANYFVPTPGIIPEGAKPFDNTPATMTKQTARY